MKIGLLSDIHGNSDALSRVLVEAKKEGVKKFLIAGDFIGYYYNAKKVFELLKEWQFIAIGGNHEKIFARYCKNRKERDLLKKKFGLSIEITYRSLDERTINWLITLPHRKEFIVEDKKVLLCHGSPQSIDEYIYPDNRKRLNDLFLEEKDILIYGHTHYPVVYKEYNKLVVNPGSVGQTRDKIPGACWAIWDVKDHIISLKRTPYDTQRLIQQCQKNDPNRNYLQTVLFER